MRLATSSVISACVIGLAVVGCGGGGGTDAGPTPMADGAVPRDAGPPVDAGPVTFATLYPILMTRCAGCHTGAGSSGMLALGSTPASAYAAMVGPDRRTAGACAGPTELVTPGDPAQSFLYLKVTNGHGGGACGAAMPFGMASGLPAGEQAIVRAWIENGAPAP